MTETLINDTKISFKAGCLARGAMRRRLKRLAWLTDVELDIDEVRGWVDSDFYVRVSGQPQAVSRFVNQWAQEMAALEQLQRQKRFA